MVTDATLSQAERSKTAVPLPAAMADLAKSVLKSSEKSPEISPEISTGMITWDVVPSVNVRVAVMVDAL